MKKLALMFAAWVGVVGAAGGLASLCACEGTRTAYAAAASTHYSTQALHVEGTDCASCTLAIRHALKKLDGVHEVRPNPSDQTQVLISYEASRVKPEQLAAAVNALGFKASLVPAVKGS